MTVSTYRKTVLENGICVITERMPAVRSIALGVLTNAGPRFEKPEQSGLAHLVEHAIFQGTSNRDRMEISRLMDMAGGQMGGFTTRDYTFYSATVLDDYLTYALDLLGDMLLNSTFPSDNLETEKGAILCEIDAARDIPSERARALLNAFAWPDHPLGRPVSGRPDTVRKLTREHVIYFVHQHYLPDRITVAGAGNVEHDEFVAQVRDALWRMLGHSEPAAGPSPEYHAGAVLEHNPFTQAYFSMGIRACPYAHPDRYALHLLNNILGGGTSSRLFRRMREKQGLVYFIGSGYHAYQDDGLIVIEGSTAPEHLMQVLELTLLEIWKLIKAEEPVTEEELWKAKMQIRGQHLIAAENTNTRMGRLATQEFYFGRRITTEEVLSKIESVEERMLQGLARDVFEDPGQQLAIAVVGPDAPKNYSQASIEELRHSLH